MVMRLKRIGMAGATLVALAVNASAVSLPDRVEAATRQDALTAARFSISIDGTEIASFSELQGIASSVDLIPSDDDPPLGRGKSLTVVLRRPLNRDISMAAWHELVLLGDVAAARKSCSLVMFDAENRPVARYHLENAWPSKIEVGSLKAGTSGVVLMETVTMTCEFIQRVSV